MEETAIAVPWEHCNEKYITNIRIPKDLLPKLTGVHASMEEWAEFLEHLEQQAMLDTLGGAEKRSFCCTHCGYPVDVGAELRSLHKIWKLKQESA